MIGFLHFGSNSVELQSFNPITFSPNSINAI